MAENSKLPQQWRNMSSRATMWSNNVLLKSIWTSVEVDSTETQNPSVPHSEMKYLSHWIWSKVSFGLVNAMALRLLGESSQLWHKYPFGLKGELIIFWPAKVKFSVPVTQRQCSQYFWYHGSIGLSLFVSPASCILHCLHCIFTDVTMAHWQKLDTEHSM